MNTEIKNVVRKLQQARCHIKSNNMKKDGQNKFSKYSYFTPEQINLLVSQAEKETTLFHKFDMIKNENGYLGTLEIIDFETGESILFKQVTDIPELKATNITQQIGGAVTYTNRYLLMTAFDITENDSDFDAQDNREQSKNDKKKGIVADALKAIQNAKTSETLSKIKKGMNVYIWNKDEVQTLTMAIESKLKIIGEQ